MEATERPIFDWDDFEYSLYSMNLKESDIRKLLELARRPGFINLGGGLPDPKIFPREKIREITNDILSDPEYAGKALQYGLTGGPPELKQSTADFLYRSMGIETNPENIILTTGAQQGIFLTTQVCTNPGDTIIASSPTYLGFQQAIRPMGINTVEIPMDKDGMRVDFIPGRIEEHVRKTGKKPKLIYTIPTAHNPASVDMPEKRRKKLLDIANEYSIPILEDDPYSLIRYEGESIDSLKKMDDTGLVSLLVTNSKIMCPGLRVGAYIASEKFLKKITLAKQPIDLCSPPFTQYIAHEFLERRYVDEHIPNVTKLYKKKRDLMAEALTENLGDLDVNVKVPTSGLFFYLEFPEGTDTTKMLDPHALGKKVVYIRGAAFYSDCSMVSNEMRVNFSSSSIENNRVGAQRLRSAFDIYNSDHHVL